METASNPIIVSYQVVYTCVIAILLISSIIITTIIFQFTNRRCINNENINKDKTNEKKPVCGWVFLGSFIALIALILLLAFIDAFYYVVYVPIFKG